MDKAFNVAIKIVVIVAALMVGFVVGTIWNKPDLIIEKTSIVKYWSDNHLVIIIGAIVLVGGGVLWNRTRKQG